MKRRTRNYAKRQLTWMRRLRGIRLADARARLPARSWRRTREAHSPYWPRWPSVLSSPPPPTPSAISRARRSTSSRPASTAPCRRRRKADDQARMYDALTPLFDDVTNRDLTRYFKSEKLGTKGQGRMTRERVPRSGVTILRDKSQRAAHLRAHERRRDLGRGLGARARPRAAPRAGALQRARGRARRAGHERDRADHRAEELPAERAGRARAQQGDREAAQVRQAAAAS